MKKLPGLTDEQADKIAGKFAKSIGVGFLQDVEIWKNKTRIDNPLLCEEDGPVYQLRRWYEQFYVDVEDVTDGDDPALRVRSGHHEGERGVGGGGRGEPGRGSQARGRPGPRRRPCDPGRDRRSS